MPPQFPPVGSFFVQNGASDILRMISVSTTTLTSNPSFSWQNDKENWFTPSGLNLDSTFAACTSITIRLDHHAPKTPAIDSTIQSTADALANATNWSFQIYAKGTLTTSDWISGAPAYGSKAYYFVENGAASDRPRVLFDVDSTNTTKLKKMIWYAPVNTVTAYLAGVADGTTITLDKKPLTDIPASGYYYKT